MSVAIFFIFSSSSKKDVSFMMIVRLGLMNFFNSSSILLELYAIPVDLSLIVFLHL